jgi:branched-chain amino acid transport system ATP-binding protein
VNVLEIANLSLRIGVQDILHDISLDVAEKGIYAILGANGVGKTSLMRCISGIYHPTGGEIRYEGNNIVGLKSHQIVDLGILQAPEGRQIFSNMSVLENLTIGGGPLKTAELDRVLGLFPKLKERLKQGAGSLSGGEQQMLAIARALMGRPRLLLLDEPSLGLAPLIVKQIFDAIAVLNRTEGLTVFLVEQNAYHALKLAHRGYVMVNGVITMSGTGKELLSKEEVKAAYLEGGRH